MITAEEIMLKNTPTLAFDSSVDKAIDFMNANLHHFAAVIASEDRYQGVLTEGAMVRIYLRYQANPKKEALIFYRDVFEPLQLIHKSADFSEIVKKIMTAVGNRVFVIDDAGKVVGHITAKDILPLISKGGKTRHPLTAPEELLSELYLYESFFEKSPFMMHSVDRNGRIFMANEILHSMLGYAYGELIGKTIFDLYPKSAHLEAAKGIETIFDKGFHKVVRGAMIRRDGSLLNVELMSRALHDQKDQPVGTITVSRPLDMEYLIRCFIQ